MLLGTARYAAPEQGRRASGWMGVPTSTRCRSCWSRRSPGRCRSLHDTTMATLMARCDGDLEVPEELGRLAPVIERAGRLDPDDRCSAGELEIAFLAAAEDLPRPEPLSLSGPLVPPRDDVAEDSDAELEADDITIVLPVGIAADDDGDDPQEAETDSEANDDDHDPDTAIAPVVGGGLAEAAGIDIPLDSEPVPVAEDSSDAAARSIEDSVASPEFEVDHDGDSVDDVEVAGRGRRSGRWVRRTLWVVVLGTIALALVVAYLLIRTPSHEVPDFVGGSLSEAEALADERGWTVETDRARVDGTDPDEVIEQSPGAGERLAEGETVDLTVSLGPTLVEFPDLAGLAEADASAALESAGLVAGEVSEEHHEEVEVGVVISHDAEVDSAGRLPRGTTVALVISSGPAPREIPDGLVGAQVDDVEAQAHRARTHAEGLRGVRRIAAEGGGPRGRAGIGNRGSPAILRSLSRCRKGPSPFRFPMSRA